MDVRLTVDEYATLVEQAPLLIWRAGTDAKCNYFNSRWLQFTGRTAEQEHGDGWAEGVHPEDLERCVRTYLDHFERREAFEMEYRLRRHDGAWRWIQDRGVPFKGPAGEFAGYIGSCIDVTERVEAQAEIRRRESARARELIGLLPICAKCKSIRDDKGYWQQVERYIAEHSEAEFTHTFCPVCADELYGASKKKNTGPTR